MTKKTAIEEADTGDTKVVEVVAGLCVEHGSVLLIQRNESPVPEWSGAWAFPGGKVEQGETLENALWREFREEVQQNILVRDRLHTMTYRTKGYPHPYRVTTFLVVFEGAPRLHPRAGQGMRWESAKKVMAGATGLQMLPGTWESTAALVALRGEEVLREGVVELRLDDFPGMIDIMDELGLYEVIGANARRVPPWWRKRGDDAPEPVVPLDSPVGREVAVQWLGQVWGIDDPVWVDRPGMLVGAYLISRRALFVEVVKEGSRVEFYSREGGGKRGLVVPELRHFINPHRRLMAMAEATARYCTVNAMGVTEVPTMNAVIPRHKPTAE